MHLHLDNSPSSLSTLKVGQFTHNEKDSCRMRALSWKQIHVKNYWKIDSKYVVEISGTKSAQPNQCMEKTFHWFEKEGAIKAEDCEKHWLNCTCTSCFSSRNDVLPKLNFNRENFFLICDLIWFKFKGLKVIEISNTPWNSKIPITQYKKTQRILSHQQVCKTLLITTISFI